MLYRIIKSLLFVGLVTLIVACSEQAQENRDDTEVADQYTAPELFNQSWVFFKSDEQLALESLASKASWEGVTLPHTANLEPRVIDEQQWVGDAWYRKTFEYRESWVERKVIIDFEAAMNHAQVWLNGQLLAEHHGGYLPFSVELNSALVEGENTLLVRLDNRHNPITGPKPLETLDFNWYSGIYRNVWLRVENQTHISDAVAADRVASGGIFIRFPKVSEAQSTVEIQTHIVGAQVHKDLKLLQTLFDGDTIVAKSEAALAITADEHTDAQTLEIDQAQLWSPSSPKLYRLETALYSGETRLDFEAQRIGIRKFELVDNQLFINGKQHFLRGVNRHQEYPHIGYMVSDAAQYRDAEKIKAAGFDYVRLSHYPHSKAFMHAADELGLVLLDAILGWQYVGEHPQFESQVLQTCRDMIRRDRNHASVLAWECSLNESPMTDELITKFHQVVQEEFPASYSAGWTEQGYDIYLQARQHRIGHYKKPNKPYVVSEYGDWEYYAMNAGLNQDAWGDLRQEERSSRQRLESGDVRLQQQAANIIEAHDDNFTTPAFADGYWVMFDYNRGYAPDLESSGIMSLERLPKFSYFFYQSQRSPNEFAGPLAIEPMVYIASHWNQQSSLSFPVFSNAERVELFLNGRSLGELPRDQRYQRMASSPFVATLESFEAGELSAKAFIGEELVAEHSVLTPGLTTALELVLDHSSKAPEASRNDGVFIYAKLLQQDGSLNTLNGVDVSFSVEGDARWVSPEEIPSQAGIAPGLLIVGDNLDDIVITASVVNKQGETLTASSSLQALVKH